MEVGFEDMKVLGQRKREEHDHSSGSDSPSGSSAEESKSSKLSPECNRHRKYAEGKSSQREGKEHTRQNRSMTDSNSDNASKSNRERRSHRSSHSTSRKHSRSSRTNPDKRTRARSRSRSHSRKRSHSHRRPRSRSSEKRRSQGRSSKSSRSSHRKSSDSRRSRSPRHRSRSLSPHGGYDQAMAAQERLARRLERAKELMKRREELKSKEKDEQLRKISGLSADDRVQEAVKRAAQLVSSATSAMPESTQDVLTAQISAQVQALKAKALADTGIEVPSYYNPLAVNPISYAQQAAKRKKLWAKTDDKSDKKEASAASSSAEKTALWSGVKFGDDKSNEKFAKLMGIKGDKLDGSVSQKTSEIIRKQAEVFQNLDMQYQQARITTHTQRGLGLGFSSSMIDPNETPASQPTKMSTLPSMP